MRVRPSTTHAVRWLAERLALCGWVLALIVAAQGWVPAGAEWHAGAGRSLWSRCGSAMCACPVEAITPVQRAMQHQRSAACCGEENEEPAAAEPHGGLRFVALGSTRRDSSSRGASMPESLVLQMPPVSCGEIDGVFAAGRRGLPAPEAWRGLAVDVPPTPPRA